MSYSMTSVSETLDSPPPEPTIVERSNIMAYFGIWVDAADGDDGNVSFHHLTVAHVETGIQLGWASFGYKDDPSCVTNACVRLSYQLPSGSSCGVGSLAYLNVFGGYRCIVQSQASGCSPNYCPMARWLYRGSSSGNGQVRNSSFCDVDQGISGAYASRLDITKNLVLGVRATPNGFTDAGIWTYSDSTVTNNYVTSGDHSHSAEGSNFPYVDNEAWKAVTGFYPTDPGINGDDYQILGQYLVAEANLFFLANDAYGGFGMNVRITNNRFLDFAYGGSAMVRQSMTWVGDNEIRGLGAGSSRAGVFLMDCIGTSVYGNSISAATNGIWVLGFPGVNSQDGSINNTCYQNYDPGSGSFTTSVNTFSNVTTPYNIAAGSVCVH